MRNGFNSNAHGRFSDSFLIPESVLRERVRINHQINASQLRVIGPVGENFGVLTLTEALKRAGEAELDLIEISPDANPPVAKITDYGKFRYEQNKKQKIAKTKTHTVEVKNVQVKIGTSEHDLALKAKKVGEWLREGNRVKVDLYLVGRSKYMEMKFLTARLERILRLIPIEYKVADPIRRGPKGLSMVIEKA